MKEDDRRIYFIRHGEREDRGDGSHGPDPGLSEFGFRQAFEVAALMKAIAPFHLFSSPFKRTIQTALVIAREVGSKIYIEPGFSEVHSTNLFSSKPVLEDPSAIIDKAYFADDYKALKRPTFPETKDECMMRCGEVIAGLMKQFEGNLVVVGHWASIISCVSFLMGTEQNFACPVGSVSMVTGTSSTGWRLYESASAYRGRA